MKIGVLGAMEEELQTLREQLKDPRETKKAGFTFYSGTLAGQETVLLLSGIGKVNAAVGTALLLENYKVQALINTGVAGGLAPGQQVGDLVISEEVCHYDVDAVPFGYARGQVPGMPLLYPADPRLTALALAAVPSERKKNAALGLIVSGDRFIHKKEDLAFLKTWFPQARAGEMEGAAVAQTCRLFGVPFVIIRALSDIAGEDKNETTYEKFLPQAARYSASLVRGLLEKIGSSF